MSAILPRLSLCREASPQTESISLDKQGDAPLTIDPPTDGLTTITKGNTTAIVSNRDSVQAFSTNDSVVATVRNHDDNNKE